jgi:hypothetical protein
MKKVYFLITIISIILMGTLPIVKAGNFKVDWNK